MYVKSYWDIYIQLYIYIYIHPTGSQINTLKFYNLILWFQGDFREKNLGLPIHEKDKTHKMHDRSVENLNRLLTCI